MKGIIFVALSEMIQEMYGHKTWNEFLSDSNAPSKGIYTSTEIYEDKEATELLTVISRKLEKSPNDILYIFGIFLIRYFHKKYPSFFQDLSFVGFLESVDGRIHVEMQKLSPGSTPPLVKVISTDEKNIQIHYRSKRKLCSLAHGLLRGASKIYQVEINITHTLCMHKGNDYCEFQCTYK